MTPSKHFGVGPSWQSVMVAAHSDLNNHDG